MKTHIRPGEPVEAMTAVGAWEPATALSRVEGIYDGGGRRIHDFPVIWIGFDGNPKKMPWPAESVRRRRRAEAEEPK